MQRGFARLEIELSIRLRFALARQASISQETT